MSELPTLDDMKGAMCWTPEYGELSIGISECLTEPVCPAGALHTEYKPGDEDRGLVLFQAVGDSIDEAVKKVVAAAYMALILRQHTAFLTVPFSNPDDKHVADLADAMARQKQKWALRPTHNQGPEG